MRRLMVISLLYLAVSPVFSQYQLKVEITNFKRQEGQVEICLYDQAEGFMNSRNAKACSWIEVSDKPIVYEFVDLPTDTYAVIVIQDLNGNKGLDTNFLRIPKEPYGFSTNPSTLFGPPDFEGASFELKEDMEIEVKLR